MFEEERTGIRLRLEVACELIALTVNEGVTVAEN
jgi:hypothetical protein